MKAIILCAGRGVRMRPLTDATPKPLAPVGPGRRLIDFTVDALRAAGVTEVVINTAHLAGAFDKIVGATYRGVRVAVSREGPTHATSLETKGGIVRALPLLSPGEEPFIACAGDIVTAFDFSTLASRLQALKEGRYSAHLVLVPNPAFHPEGDMGIRDGRLDRQAKTYTYSGIGLFSPSLFAGEPDGFAKLFPWLLDKAGEQAVSAELYTGPWHNVGTVDELKGLTAKLIAEGLYSGTSPRN